MRAFVSKKLVRRLDKLLSLGLFAAFVTIVSQDARAENTLRVGNAAAFAIVNNPPAPVQWGTRTFITPLLKSYAEHGFFEPQSTPDGDSEIDNQAFVERMTSALQRFPVVDLFILAHGNDYYFLLNDIDPQLRQRIRLVYNSGCEGEDDADQWLHRGVQAYVGHPDHSISPVFLNGFLTYWRNGRSLKDAVALANQNVYAVFAEGRLGRLLERFYSLAVRGHSKHTDKPEPPRSAIETLQSPARPKH